MKRKLMQTIRIGDIITFRDGDSKRSAVVTEVTEDGIITVRTLPAPENPDKPMIPLMVKKGGGV